ncbi:DUF4166 domain-containing protein [uncultured Ruegeria sp.]|uniref:DUF4166 domain-containing protein n=1 Tax=uncultured Ruegeria sp. TaxID=259304 RepID=UPI00262971E9|nr:DUF4166 domain-containing protein [uncultured Ruegeria sp.]
MISDPFLQTLSELEDLPPSIRALHSTEGHYVGRCDIERGTGVLVALVTRLAGFPFGGTDVAVSVQIRAEDQVWHWERDFAGHKTRSLLVYDEKRKCVRETFGAISIWLQPNWQNSALYIKILRLTIFGIPVPFFARPRSKTIEWQDAQGRFRFDVSAEAPGLGLLIRYQGWLTPDHAMRGAG